MTSKSLYGDIVSKFNYGCLTITTVHPGVLSGMRFFHGIVELHNSSKTDPKSITNYTFVSISGVDPICNRRPFKCKF